MKRTSAWPSPVGCAPEGRHGWTRTGTASPLPCVNGIDTSPPFSGGGLQGIQDLLHMRMLKSSPDNPALVIGNDGEVQQTITPARPRTAEEQVIGILGGYTSEEHAAVVARAQHVAQNPEVYMLDNPPVVKRK